MEIVTCHLYFSDLTLLFYTMVHNKPNNPVDYSLQYLDKLYTIFGPYIDIVFEFF